MPRPATSHSEEYRYSYEVHRRSGLLVDAGDFDVSSREIAFYQGSKLLR